MVAPAANICAASMRRPGRGRPWELGAIAGVVYATFTRGMRASPLSFAFASMRARAPDKFTIRERARASQRCAFFVFIKINERTSSESRVRRHLER